MVYSLLDNGVAALVMHLTAFTLYFQLHKQKDTHCLSFETSRNDNLTYLTYPDSEARD